MVEFLASSRGCGFNTQQIGVQSFSSGTNIKFVGVQGKVQRSFSLFIQKFKPYRSVTKLQAYKNGKSLICHAKLDNMYSFYEQYCKELDSDSCDITDYGPCEIKQFSFFDEYILQDPIGKGSFGNVFKAYSKFNFKQYAVKQYLKKEKEVELIRQWQMVQKERSLLNEFSYSQYVVNGIALYEEKDQFLLVQELLGETLSQFLYRQGTELSEQTVAVIFYFAIQALKELHNKDLCYADLKPDNFMFMNKFETQEDLSQFVQNTAGKQTPFQAIDLGCCERVYEGEYIKRRHGAISYMSSECVMGLYDKKTDLWSIGVMLYFLASGQLPFWRNSQEYHSLNPKQQMQCILKREVNFQVHERFQFVSEDLKDLLVHLLDKDTFDRYSISQALDHPWLQNNLPKHLLQNVKALQQQ